VRVFAASGERLDSGRPVHPGGVGSQIAVTSGITEDGAYVVTWRVVSADSHPVQGAFTFVVGDARAANDSSIADLLQQRGGSRLVGVAYATSRALVFASMLLLVGGLAFIVVVWPDGRASAGARRAVWLALALLAVASLGSIGLQGAYAGGLGLSKAVDPSVVGDVLSSRFGHVYLVRLGLLAVAAGLVAVFFRDADAPPWWRWVAGAIGVGIVATPGFAGHAAIGSHEPYALVADIAHVAAASVWLGGLAMLTLFVMPRRTDDLKVPVRRYSEVAFWAVTVLVATGVFQGWRQVGTVDALTGTPYGKLLIVKTAFVAAMLGFAWLSRRATHAKWSPDTASRVRATVAIETAIAVGVLVVTSLLVNAVPAKTLAAAPQSGELTSATLLVDYTVSPGRAGTNEIHLYALTKAGQPKEIPEMTLKLSLPGRGIAAIPVPLEVAGPGHYQSLSFTIPIKGRWRLDVVARTTEVDQETFEGTVDIR
jgi:copper transport protein